MNRIGAKYDNIPIACIVAGKTTNTII